MKNLYLVTWNDEKDDDQYELVKSFDELADLLQKLKELKKTVNNFRVEVYDKEELDELVKMEH